MPGNSGEITLNPVGVVRNGWDGTGSKPATSDIVVFEQYADAMLGVDEREHVQVFWWMHKLKPGGRIRLRCHPRGDKSKPVRGVFALRSPVRPNPIGAGNVRVVKVSDSVITVQGLDAIDGSPVLDVKSGM